MRSFQVCDYCERQTWMDHVAQCDECHRDGVDDNTDPADISDDGGRVGSFLDQKSSGQFFQDEGVDHVPAK
jgi:hypothetical protein